MKTVNVVFSLEHDNVPVPVGTYWTTQEDAVIYFAPDGEQKVAPEDCVIVVPVEVPEVS